MTFFETEKNKQQQGQSTTSQFYLYVTPLPEDVRKMLIQIKEQDLRFLFSLFGQIVKVHIVKKPFSPAYSYAFVYFHSLEAKQKAKKFCNGKMLGWKNLSVLEGRKNQLKDKKINQNWQNLTFYEEPSSTQTVYTKPKKKVHLNDTIIDQSSSKSISFKNQSNTSKTHLSTQKNMITKTFKESFDNFKKDLFPKKTVEKSEKEPFYHYSIRKKETKNTDEIDY